jgi:hypothetical protein
VIDFPVNNIGEIILIDTLVYSQFTILVLGSVLHPILVRCDVQQKVLTEEEQERLRQNKKPRNCCHRVKSSLAIFDMTVFSPLFVKNNKNIKGWNSHTSEVSNFVSDYESRYVV